MTNILAASLYQSQKYVTLDGHVWSIHAYLINERFYQGLTPTEKKAVDEATQKAIAIHRKMTSDQDKNAKQILEKVGMQVYTPTAPRSASSASSRSRPSSSGPRRRSARTTSTACSRRSTRRKSECGERETVTSPGVSAMDIVSIGEPMVEFNQTTPGDPRYLQGFGGDSSNMIIAAARSGARTAYVTRLGDDEFGRHVPRAVGGRGRRHARRRHRSAGAHRGLLRDPRPAGPRVQLPARRLGGEPDAARGPAARPRPRAPGSCTPRASAWRSARARATRCSRRSKSAGRPARRSRSTPTCGSSCGRSRARAR